MSTESFEPKELRRTNSGNIIVYNPATQELKRERRESLDVDLSKLGWQASCQRLWGKCNDIYTVGSHNQGSLAMAATAA
ncbi:uncharacterized protein KY384_003848 [Bacidia gigantensis]|uniref:uncharacterized protein n=1 Tax=Bacidia gigantensis TaxID=2732470 RepID=UPI001D04C2CB|nr:uncharacterized protein KY384_003848 [Bacidia gigantensis]KAG8532207.1 hypothetical protein KY384_003848 [Bacidia gigantensis]